MPNGGLSDKYHYYDGENRQTGSSTWGGAAFGTSSAGFDPFGRPTIIYPPDANPGDDDHAIHLSYEGFRKTKRTVNIGTVLSGGTVSETAVSRTEQYDAWGRLIAVTESSGPSGADVKTTYEYELGDRLTQATTPIGGGLNQVRTWSYDQRGFLNSECHPEKGPNGNGCTFYSQYDPMGKARQVVDGPFTRKYAYDGVSRLVMSSQWIAGSTDIFSDGFESGDLTAWSLSDIPANEYSEQIFVYDIAGNLTRITTDGTPQIHSISATTNRLTDNNFAYDGAGNLTRFPSDDGVPVQHDYDAFNRLSKRTHGDHVTRYFYTADDERIMRFGTEGFTWTLRDFGGQLLREFKPDANVGMVPQRDHTYRGGSLIGTVTPNAAGQLTVKHHYSLDHLGSPRLITDATGQVEAEHKYYPFGEETTLSSQDRHPMKFTGHERDFNEAGEGDDLDYMHARHCNPRMGRFLSVDPAEESANVSSPQSWNRYTYAHGNPIRFTDPTGRIVDLSALDETQQGQLLQGLEEFTGNTYSVDKNGHLKLEGTGRSSSAIATDFLREIIASEAKISVDSSPTGRNTTSVSTRQIELNLNSFSGAKYPKGVNRKTFNIGSTFIHEAVHAYTGQPDNSSDEISLSQDWTGPVVDFVNSIRSEQGLHIRTSYIGLETRNGKFIKFNFADPNKPNKIRHIKRRKPNGRR